MSLKFTSKQIEEITKLLKLTSKKKQLLIDNYKINIPTDQIHYQFTYEQRRGSDIYGEGLIDRNIYDYIVKRNEYDKEEFKKNINHEFITYGGIEISKHNYMSLYFNEIEFTEDEDVIEKYIIDKNKFHNYEIFEGINDDDIDEFYNSIINLPN